MSFTTLGEQTVLSDCFNFQNLDRWLWSLDDIPGVGGLRMEGAPSNGGVRLTTAASVDYTVDASGRSLKILQASNPGNFTALMRMNSALDAEGESTGVVYLYNPNNYIRFGFDYVDGNVELWAALTKNSQLAENVSTIVNFGPWDGVDPIYLRTTHDSNTWTAEWSLDGVNFMDSVTLVTPLPVNHSGPYVASAAGSSEAHTALFDFFFDDAFRIEPEDDSIRTDRTEPYIYRIATAALSSSSVRVRWFTDEPASGTLEIGETEGLELPPVVNPDIALSQEAIVDQLFGGTNYFVRTRAQDSAGNEGVSSTLTVQTPN